ncbi:MAG: polymerase, sigma-24 subunit, subfamily [Gemmatimonadetes bacterium]|nr:polymerase, sigma-24 subunit, subfamily [Gemmatimonadota bacterium]
MRSTFSREAPNGEPMDLTESQSDITLYLRKWRAGDSGARDALLSRVYDQLRRMARARLRGERPDHTLDTSGLVHEAYLRLADAGATDWQDRAHFFAVASTAMRRVLIDHAKQRQAEKRGGGLVRVDLDSVHLGDAVVAATSDPDALLALDDALAKLELVHPRQAKALELRYFVGLTLEEAALVLSTSAPTVLRDLRYAQAWLARELA